MAPGAASSGEVLLYVPRVSGSSTDTRARQTRRAYE